MMESVSQALGSARGMLRRFSVVAVALLGFFVIQVLHPSLAMADQPGKACIFNAPTGAEFKGIRGTAAGHVGWAFQRDDGSWMFGATEKENDTWLDIGAEDQMVQEFTRGNSGHFGPHYYVSYKCKSLTNAHPQEANVRALQSSSNAYRLTGDNCLDESIAILTAYGLDDMAWIFHGGDEVVSEL